MASLRQRFRDYREADDFPNTPESFECSEWRKLTGSAIVMVVGFTLSAPFGWVLLAATSAGVLPVKAAAVLAIGLFFVSGVLAKYVGGPVADHVLGIPREVSR